MSGQLSWCSSYFCNCESTITIIAWADVRVTNTQGLCASAPCAPLRVKNYFYISNKILDWLQGNCFLWIVSNDSFPLTKLKNLSTGCTALFHISFGSKVGIESAAKVGKISRSLIDTRKPLQMIRTQTFQFIALQTSPSPSRHKGSGSNMIASWIDLQKWKFW